MCDFFSCISDGKGNIKYFDAKQRRKIARNTLFDELGRQIGAEDSHSSITAFYGVSDDECNKWEYNPVTKQLYADTLRVKNDANQVKQALDNLDFTTIVPEFIPRPVVDPKKVKRNLKTVSKKEIELLKKWLRARGSGDPDDPIWDMIEAWDKLDLPIGSAIRRAVENMTNLGWTLRNQLKGSFIRTRVSHSKTGKYKFQAAVDLLEAGLLPSVGDTHAILIRAKDNKVVFRKALKELRKRK